MIHPAAWCIPIAFLAGSIPTGLLIGRWKGIDIRQHGSRNIGATNVGRVLGKKYFALCFSIDFLKGLLPPLAAGYWLGVLGSLDAPLESAVIWLACMLSTILGNVFNPWLKFKGGKGVATSLGALLGVFPPLALPGLVVLTNFLIMLKLFRYVSLASIVGAITLPIATSLLFIIAGTIGYSTSLRSSLPFLAVALSVGVLVVWTHRANITRLRLGTEPRIGERKTIPPAQAPSVPTH